MRIFDPNELRNEEVERSSERGDSAKMRKEPKPHQPGHPYTGHRESDVRKTRFLPSGGPRPVGDTCKETMTPGTGSQCSVLPREIREGFPGEVTVGQPL